MHVCVTRSGRSSSHASRAAESSTFSNHVSSRLMNSSRVWRPSICGRGRGGGSKNGGRRRVAGLGTHNHVDERVRTSDTHTRGSIRLAHAQRS